MAARTPSPFAVLVVFVVDEENTKHSLESAEFPSKTVVTEVRMMKKLSGSQEGKESPSVEFEQIDMELMMPEFVVAADTAEQENQP